MLLRRIIFIQQNENGRRRRAVRLLGPGSARRCHGIRARCERVVTRRHYRLSSKNAEARPAALPALLLTLRRPPRPAPLPAVAPRGRLAALLPSRAALRLPGAREERAGGGEGRKEEEEEEGARPPPPAPPQTCARLSLWPYKNNRGGEADAGGFLSRLRSRGRGAPPPSITPL